MTATIRVAGFFYKTAGGRRLGQSEHRRVLRDGGNGGSSDSLALFGSTEHEGLVNLSETLSFSFSLLKPHGELTLGHLKVLDVGGSAVEERNFAGLLVGDGKRVLEATVTLPEFVAPTLFRLNALTTDLLPAPRWSGFVGGGSNGLEIVIIIGIGRLGLLLGAIPGYTRRGLSDGVVSNVARDRRRGRADGSTAAPSRLHTVRGQLARAKVSEGSGVNATRGSVGARGGSDVRSARSVGWIVSSDGHRAHAGRGNVSGEIKGADRGGRVGEAHVLKTGVRVVSVDAGWVHQFWGLAGFESEMLERGLHCRMQMKI